MTDYEKGSPAWDIGMILTRHKMAGIDGFDCARSRSLRETTGMPSHIRLSKALATPCDCGAGDNNIERTSNVSTKLNPAA